MQGPFLVRSSESHWAVTIVRIIALAATVTGGALWWQDHEAGLIVLVISGIVWAMVEVWITVTSVSRRWVEFDDDGFIYRTPSRETRFRNEDVQGMALTVKAEYNQGKPVGTRVRCTANMQSDG